MDQFKGTRSLRRWLKGEGAPDRPGVGIDRKTARRYIAAAVELGVDRDGGEGQLSDELIGQVVERVRPHRPDGHGEAWRVLLGEEERIKAWVARTSRSSRSASCWPGGCGGAAPDVGSLRGGTLRGGRRTVTVRVDDPPPGVELQVDFGRLGLIPDGERRRVCQG